MKVPKPMSHKERRKIIEAPFPVVRIVKTEYPYGGINVGELDDDGLMKVDRRSARKPELSTYDNE